MMPLELQQKVNGLSELEYRALRAAFGGLLRTAAHEQENLGKIAQEVEKLLLLRPASR